MSQILVIIYLVVVYGNDYGAGTFSCVFNPPVWAPGVSTSIVNGSTVQMNGKLDITCKYNNINTPANITIYERQSRKILAFANMEMAHEENGKYRLSCDYQSFILKSMWLDIDFTRRNLNATFNWYLEHQDAVTVKALPFVTAELGATITIPCDFHYSSNDIDFLELYWLEVNDETFGWIEYPNYYRNIYKYSREVRTPVTPPWRTEHEMRRYKLSNHSLVIENFQETDRRTKCCQVFVFKRYSYNPSYENLAGIDEACTVIGQNYGIPDKVDYKVMAENDDAKGQKVDFVLKGISNDPSPLGAHFPVILGVCSATVICIILLIVFVGARRLKVAKDQTDKLKETNDEEQQQEG